jgi:hypothetical protein
MVMLSVYGELEHPPAITIGGIVVWQAATTPPPEWTSPVLPVLELPDPDAVIVVPSIPPIVTDAAPEPVEDEPVSVAALPADVWSLGWTGGGGGGGGVDVCCRADLCGADLWFAKAICSTPDTITNPAAIIPDKTISKLTVVFFIRILPDIKVKRFFWFFSKKCKIKF